MNRRSCGRLMPIWAALLVLIVAGCAAPAKKPRVFWPPPPDKPRLEWINVYSSEESFPKTAAERFAEGALGKPQRTTFKQPMGIASDGKGKVYVADIISRMVRVYDLDGYEISSLSDAPVFKSPVGVAIDREGRIYVGNGPDGQVLVFGQDHRPLHSFGGPEYMQKATYLAIDDDLDRIYVTDPLAHKIAVFDKAGEFLFSFGETGSDDGELFGPQGVAIDSEHRVFVANTYNFRIEVFDADGTFLYNFGEQGDARYQFEFPSDLAFDSEGNLHIVDARKAALMTFAPEGKMLLYTGLGRTIKAVGFSMPIAITVDSTDRIYISDAMNRRFSVWQYLSARYLQEHPIE